MSLGELDLTEWEDMEDEEEGEAKEDKGQPGKQPKKPIHCECQAASFKESLSSLARRTWWKSSAETPPAPASGGR